MSGAAPMADDVAGILNWMQESSARIFDQTFVVAAAQLLTLRPRWRWKVRRQVRRARRNLHARRPRTRRRAEQRMARARDRHLRACTRVRAELQPWRDLARAAVDCGGART